MVSLTDATTRLYSGVNVTVVPCLHCGHSTPFNCPSTLNGIVCTLQRWHCGTTPDWNLATSAATIESSSSNGERCTSDRVSILAVFSCFVTNGFCCSIHRLGGDGSVFGCLWGPKVTKSACSGSYEAFLARFEARLVVAPAFLGAGDFGLACFTGFTLPVL